MSSAEGRKRRWCVFFGVVFVDGRKHYCRRHVKGETSVLPERLIKEFINEGNHCCINFVVNVALFKELIETYVCYGFYDRHFLHDIP